MRVLSIGNFTTSWDGSQCDEEHIAKALEDMGHTVYRMQREQLWEALPEVDFTLIAQWNGYGDMTWLPRPIVYWAFDYQADGQEWHDRLIYQSDIYLSKQLSDSKHLKWRWLPQDFAPDFLYRDWTKEVEKDIDVLFTGSYLPWATARIETLRAVDKMFNLRIVSFTPDDWGREGFKDVHPPIMDEGLRSLIPRAKVNLSIDHTYAPGYFSDRNAQILACGGRVLFKHVPMSEIVFRDHVTYYRKEDECLDKINTLLDEADTHAKVRYNFAQENLMVHNRVQDLLTIVETW